MPNVAELTRRAFPRAWDSAWDESHDRVVYKCYKCASDLPAHKIARLIDYKRLHWTPGPLKSNVS